MIAGKDRREPTPGIDEAHRLGADARRVELGLIGVEGEGEPVRRQRDEDAENDQQHHVRLLREEQAEDGDARRRPGDLPFALEIVGEPDADERADRIGDGDDEGVFEAGGEVNASSGQQSWNPVAEAVKSNGLQKIENRQQQRAAAVGRTEDFAKSGRARI